MSMQDEFAGVLTVQQRNAMLKEIQNLESKLQDMRQQEPEQFFKGSRFTTRNLLQNRRRQQFNKRFKRIRDRILQLRKRLGKDSTPIETKIKTGESLTGGKPRQRLSPLDKKVRRMPPAKKSTDKKPTPFLNEKKILGEGMPSPLTSKQRLDTVRQNVNKMSPEEKEAGRKRNQAIKKEIRNFGQRETDAGMEGVLDTQSILLEGDKYVSPDFSPDRDRLERSIKSAPEDKNIVEQLVSKLLGRNIRFEDIPDDDPDFDQGLKSEGHIAYPAGRPDLRMGGMTARSAATTKFKKPLGMMGGGNITRAQRQRIARIMQDYKQKKARKSNGKRTNR